MSRVYRALEKAEKEKKQREEGDPSLKVFEEKKILMKEKPVLKFPTEEIEALRLPTKEEGPVLIVPPHSFAGEEFRKLKAQIFQRLPNPPHSILITSAAPAEGKTMVAVNLAMAISQEIHRKAILVDADLRKPGIYLEGNQYSKGLSNYLSDGTPLSEILVNSETENLRTIMAGPSSSISSELIGSNRMEELLRSLSESEENTYIIIDSPPIIATTEPTLLSKMVDGIILVVMVGQTPRGSIKRAIKIIDKDKIIGIVFNQIDLKPLSYYSQNYYRYYQYYRK